MFVELLHEKRYAQPSGDSNRSRWPDHILWKMAKEEINKGMNLSPADVDENYIKCIHEAVKREEMGKQLVGLSASYGALMGVKSRQTENLSRVVSNVIADAVKRDRKKVEKKILDAFDRYGSISVTK